MSTTTKLIAVKLCQTENELNQVIQMATQNIKTNESLTQQDKSKGFLNPLINNQFLQTNQRQKTLFIAKNQDQVVAFLVCRKIQDLRHYHDFEFCSKVLQSIKGYSFKGQQIEIDPDNLFYGPVFCVQKWRSRGLKDLLFDYALERFSKINQKLITFINMDNYASLNSHISTGWRIIGRQNHLFIMMRQIPNKQF